MAKRTDKRVIKTKNSIKTAFMELMLTESINKITISDIAEKAYINRATFYLHYADVYEVMDDIEKDISNKILGCFQKVALEDKSLTESIYLFLGTLYDELESMTAVKKYILSSTNSNELQERLKNWFVENITATVAKKTNEVDLNRISLTFTFLVGGIMESFTQWYYKKEKPITLSELQKELTDLVARIIVPTEKAIENN